MSIKSTAKPRDVAKSSSFTSSLPPLTAFFPISATVRIIFSFVATAPFSATSLAKAEPPLVKKPPRPFIILFCARISTLKNFAKTPSILPCKADCKKSTLETSPSSFTSWLTALPKEETPLAMIPPTPVACIAMFAACPPISLNNDFTPSTIFPLSKYVTVSISGFIPFESLVFLIKP